MDLPAARPGPGTQGPEHLLVDGYNVIFAWDEPAPAGREQIWTAARGRLMDILCNYAGYRQDACPSWCSTPTRSRDAERSVEKYHNLYVVYTKEAETADMYIEKTTHAIARKYPHARRHLGHNGAAHNPRRGRNCGVSIPELRGGGPRRRGRDKAVPDGKTGPVTQKAAQWAAFCARFRPRSPRRHWLKL